MNLLKLCLGLCLISIASADKAPIDLKASESQKLVSTVKEIKKIVVSSSKDSKKQDEAQDRIDSLDEKSDIYEAASTSNLEAGNTVSQGNLYYYYYPVAAYPVHASDKVSSSSSSSASTSLLESPLVFILVPLVLLLIGAALIPFLVSNTNTNTGRSFGRASSLDDKFGSFDELQEAIDQQLTKYMTALDSEDCMDRIVCELGTKASAIPHKNLFFR